MLYTLLTEYSRTIVNFLINKYDGTFRTKLETMALNLFIFICLPLIPASRWMYPHTLHNKLCSFILINNTLSSFHSLFIGWLLLLRCWENHWRHIWEQSSYVHQRMNFSVFEQINNREFNTLLWVLWERNCSTMRGSKKKFQLDLSVRKGCLGEVTWKYEFVERRGIRKLIHKMLMHIQRVRACIKQSRMKPSMTGMSEGEEKWDLRDTE